MSDYQFSINLKWSYVKEKRKKEGHNRNTTLLRDKINAEHDDVLKKYFSTEKPCKKLWSKLPKEIQDITEVQEFFRETLLNEFFR